MGSIDMMKRIENIQHRTRQKAGRHRIYPPKADTERRSFGPVKHGFAFSGLYFLRLTSSGFYFDVGRWMLNVRRLLCGAPRFAVAVSAAVAALLLTGCGHTQPMVAKTHFTGAQTGQTIGLEFMLDINQFNYAPLVKEEILKNRCFRKVILTHDVADPRCDYVIRGNFSFYKISTYNNTYYTSIYLFLLPLITGIPYSHLDGGTMAGFEVYRGGVLFKAYKYKDIFWDERGLWSLYPTPGPKQELRRLTRLFLKEMMQDFFGFEGTK